VGLYLSSFRNTPGGIAMQAIVDDWDAVKPIFYSFGGVRGRK
jgi:hypothetical protein